MLTIDDLKNPVIYKQVLEYVNQRIDGYYNSKCYRSLCSRVDRLYNLIYMNKEGSRNVYTGANEWQSKITVPLVREMYLILRAAMKKSWAQDPIITLEPISSNTSYINAINSQEILNLNYINTSYRDKCLKEVYRNIASYGTSLAFTQYEQRESKVKKTVYDPIMGYSKAAVGDVSANCWNYIIPIKHYFQNPDIDCFDNSDFRGHQKRYFLTDLISEIKRYPELYIKERLKKVVEESRKGVLQTSNISKKENLADHNVSLDVYRYTGKLQIKGNEEDDTTYVMQLAGEHIFRFNVNDNDYGIDGYSCFNIDKFQDFWWSNTPIENVVPHQNIMDIIMQMNMDNAMRQLERYIFYDSGSIDIADIHNRHKNGGFIGVKIKDFQSQNMISEYQAENTAKEDLQLSLIHI